MSRPTNVAPQRAIAVITSRNAERPRRTARVRRAAPSAFAQHRLQQREVQRQEHVLDDDDPEDEPALGIREPVQFGQQLRDDRRRRDADRARDDQRFLRPPSEREPERQPATEVQREVDRAAIASSDRPPASRSPIENSRPRWKSSRMSPSAASSSRSCGSSTSDDAGRVRPEDDPGEHEERDRRQPDAPAEPGQDPGREERAAERDELVTHGQPTTWRTKRAEVLLAADDDEAVAGAEHLASVRARRSVPTRAGSRRRSSSCGAGSPGRRSCGRPRVSRRAA